MSAPLVEPSITVEPDAVAAIAAELSALAGELSDDAALCRSAAASFLSALSGDEGWASGETATAWARLGGAGADRRAAGRGTLPAGWVPYRRGGGGRAWCVGRG